MDITPQLPLFTTAPHDPTLVIEWGYCHCGCGQKTKVNKYTNRSAGYLRGEPMHFVKGHHRRPKTVFTEDYFWTYVEKRGPDDCWLWQGPKSPKGYGFDRDARFFNQHLAHRVAWIFTNGMIVGGLHVLHKCDINYPVSDRTYRACCNPTHLFLGTNDDNIADMIAKGRHSHGKTHGNTKLTEEQVVEIRKRYAQGGILQRELGEQYSVCRGTISSVLRGENWGWLK